MSGTPPPTNQPSDTMDHVQECQDLLMEIEELSKQKEEHIRRLAVCDVTVEKRERMAKTFTDRKTDAAKKRVQMPRANLDEFKESVAGYLQAIKELQSAYREQILGVLKNADSGWLLDRRKMLLTAFHLAKDIHTLIMQRSEDIVSHRKRKRRPIKSRRKIQLSRTA
ncbi:MAG: hypothetical protein Q9191_001424 [Dirinaria sp. TL-2023a]